MFKWLLDKLFEEILQPFIKHKIFVPCISFIITMLAYIENHFSWTVLCFILLFAVAIGRVIQLLYREKSTKYEINKEQQKSEISLKEYFAKQNQKQVNQLLANLPMSNNPSAVIHQIYILTLNFPQFMLNNVKSVIEKLNISTPTQDQKSIIMEIMSKFDPYQVKIAKLLNKILENLKNDEKIISKAGIQFLTSITDNELEDLKNQFKYVDPTYYHGDKALGGWILLSSTIDAIFRQYQLNEDFCGDVVKFSNTIWVQRSGMTHATWRHSIQQHELDSGYDTNCWSLGKKKALRVNDKPPVTLTLHLFQQLTRIGTQIYNLLQDEIEPMPDDYIQKVFEYHKNMNENLNLELIDYDHSQKSPTTK